METLRQNFLPTIAEAGSDTVMTHRLQVIKTLTQSLMTRIKATYLYIYTKTDTMGYYILYYTNTIDIVHIYTYIDDKLNNYYYTIPTPTLYTHTHTHIHNTRVHTTCTVHIHMYTNIYWNNSTRLCKA